MAQLFKGIRFLIYALIGLLLLLCILFAVLQSKWAKEQIKEKLISYLENFGISARIENLNGRLPFSWTIDEADLIFSNNDALQLSDVRLRVGILSLLRGKITVDYLKTEHAVYSYFPSSDQQLSLNKAWIQHQLQSIRLPGEIDIHHFKVSQMDMVNCEDGSMHSFELSGEARTRHDDFTLDLSLYSLDFKKPFFEIYLDGNKRKNFIATRIKFQCDAAQGQIAAEFNLEGPWTTWEEILYDLPRTEEPLRGELKGVLTNVHVANADLLNRDWKFKSEFSILSGDEAYIQKFLLLSDLIHLKGKGTLYSDLEKSRGMIAFSLPDLSQIPLPYAMEGSAEGKAYYREGAYKASFQTHQLQVDAFAARSVRGLIKGSEEDNEWEAEVRLSSEDADLPFENIFAVEFVPEKSISIIDFDLKLPEASMQGYLSYDLEQRLFTSSLFADVNDLGLFAPYLKEENLGGSLQAGLQLFPEEEEQTVQCALAAKGMRVREYLLDELRVNVEIADLFDTPFGQMNAHAEKVYTPNLYLDRLDFGTSSDEWNWPFYLETEGRIESPFHLFAKGFWQKENALFSLELTQLFGDIAGTAFTLKYPCEFEWAENDLRLSPFDFRIGDGHLYSLFEFSPLRSFAKWDLQHLPMEILSCLRPRFKLNGFISANGYFDATPEKIIGSLNTAIENIEVLHFGKKEPLRAKGTLQAHLDQGMVQIQSNLYAIDEQFLDFMASLPVDYQLYPFQIAFNEEKNTSAELIAEGKLQDLFDFVNLGTNHFTGLVSCRLFLSRTLDSPSLQGELEWQNGTYENYFTGIALRNIGAKFEAHNDAVHLVQLNANDEKKGEVFAQGTLLLKPKEQFPYAFNAELKNLHALGFDMIDCNLTGPFYLSGHLQEMLAQGNLLIDEAKIQLNERLPYEVPTLPFTFVNRPAYLYSKPVNNQPGFLFQLDLELTADNKVFVEGRGLNAELEGNIHLHGTNTNIAANGALKLIKGEYQFSGKVFKLTEGEIVFNDKPAPSAYLNLNGTLSMPDITITAMLRGPLTAPQLTFQSNPQKPTSSILALILFNKDIADISHPEAIQLASTLVSLSGGAGPDVLETIRKSIGVDRLNISSKPGTDEIAVQIGKYLTRGIMITLSQSATSSQVIVEVELPKGFIFQAETQEEQEGKFSLKWRRSY